MMRKAAGFAALATLLLSTGCITYSLEELRHATPKGNAFQNALSREYLAFASSEEKQYDWWDAIYFADKGLRAAYGKDVAPEELASWNISAGKREDLARARVQLASALGRASMSRPEIAARAQVYFDCWVEQQEENWQNDDIARCRDGLKDTLEQLGAGMVSEKGEAPDVLAEAPEPSHKKKQKPAPDMEPMDDNPVGEPVDVEPVREEASPVPMTSKLPPSPTPANSKESYVVFFEKHEIEPSVSGQHIIQEVLQTLENQHDYQIVLSSHTDTVGDPKENLVVSEQRAQAVKDRLIKGGADADRIKSFAYGESDPPVKTKDEVDEPANRRVEIFLSE